MNAEKFADLLAKLTDPRITDAELVQLVEHLDLESLRSTVVTLAASTSGYAVAHASQLDVSLDDYMAHMRNTYRNYLTTAEEASHD